MHSWSEQGEPLRLQELSKDKNDPDPKALACYGMLSADNGRMHLRFVSGRPVSQVTTDFLEWLCEQVQVQGKRVLLLIWDNASWHVSKQVKTWLHEHNQTVLQEAQTGKTGVRINSVLVAHQESLAQRDPRQSGSTANERLSNLRGF